MEEWRERGQKGRRERCGGRGTDGRVKEERGGRGRGRWKSGGKRTEEKKGEQIEERGIFEVCVISRYVTFLSPKIILKH